MSIRKVVTLAGLALVAVLVTVPLATSADGDDPVRAHTFLVRTVEDPSVAPVPNSDCPGGAGLILKPRGFAWSIATRAKDGMVVKQRIQRVGVVSTCTRVTFPLVEGDTAPMHAQIELGGDEYIGDGACRVTSNGVPQGGVVLAGCALRLHDGPDGFVGGIAASASILTLGPVPGFETGSFWTLRVYSSD